MINLTHPTALFWTDRAQIVDKLLFIKPMKDAEASTPNALKITNKTIREEQNAVDQSLQQKRIKFN
jgi:hypothetical protein